ncbi:aminotransferase class I/II-fold pyridoxal phosphate-dependent enzyme [Dawidia soli]|nr:8-amino-7-oxononanoate synthase [Dawidia soli]
MMDFDAVLRNRLAAREGAGLLRTLRQAVAPIDFTSNDYIGLARSPELFAAIGQKLEQITPPLNGATGSRLLSGNSGYTEQVEATLARIFSAGATLIFQSGYSANLSVLSSMPQRGDTILCDELVHASIKDGMRLSLAKHHNFRHNDLQDLEDRLQRATGNVFIVVESIYSMDGDTCPLEELVALAERYSAFIILDEAHSTGVVGPGGSGLAVALGVHDKIAVRIYTFGKAMGIHGACVAGTRSVVEYLVNFARPFIYTTALPPHSMAAIDCAFAYVQAHGARLQQALRDTIEYFVQQVQDLPHVSRNNGAIQTALYPGNEHVRQVARQWQAAGFDVRPILSPTVPAGAERMRICLHTFNTREEIDLLASCLRALPGMVP